MLNEAVLFLLTVVSTCAAPAIPHSGVRGSVAANYSAGSIVEIVCDASYRFPHIKSSVLQVVCRADGTWTDLLGIENVPACECELILPVYLDAIFNLIRMYLMFYVTPCGVVCFFQSCNGNSVILS